MTGPFQSRPAPSRLADIFNAFAGCKAAACHHIDGDLDFDRLHASALVLAARIAGDRSPVLICGHKHHSYLVAYWACLLAARPLIPIEPELPLQRLLDIAESAAAGLVLKAGDAGPAAHETGLPVIDVSGYLLSAAETAEFTPIPREAGDAAYIMFSSGTSGKPKGIKVSYANLDGFIEWLDKDLLGDVELQAVTGNVRYCFDVSLFEIWTSWLRRVPVSALDHSEYMNSRKYIERYRQHRAGLWVSTPSAIQPYLRDPQFSAAQLPDLKLFIFCGEVLPKPLAASLMERFQGARIINTYGPTECTVAVTSAEITPAHLQAEASLPIGKPRKGCGLSLEDGQIVISGAAVGPGYVNLPDAQARTFPAFQTYRTGDIGYQGADGLWYFKGRADREIKLLGVRIDLNEIEDHIRNLPGVEAACVTTHTVRGTPRALNAFVCGAGSEKQLAEMAGRMADALPPWLVPRFWFGCPQIKVNHNSKLDRPSLIEAAQSGGLRHVTG